MTTVRRKYSTSTFIDNKTKHYSSFGSSEVVERWVSSDQKRLPEFRWNIVGGEARAFCRSRSQAGVPPSSGRPGLPCRSSQAISYLLCLEYFTIHILQHTSTSLYFLLKETIHQKDFDVLGEQKIINVGFSKLCNSLDLSELPASNLLSVILVWNLGYRIKACNWVDLVKFDESLGQNIKFFSQVEENKSCSQS